MVLFLVQLYALVVGGEASELAGGGNGYLLVVPLVVLAEMVMNWKGPLLLVWISYFWCVWLQSWSENDRL